ncbi:hypothetical protein ABIB68_008183 [Bradyrhizobium sp. F1.2.2]
MCSVVSLKLQQTSCSEISFEIFNRDRPSRDLRGSDNILNHQRAYLVSAHQLRGNGDSFVHSNRNNARGFLAQHVSDLHHNLLLMGPGLLALAWAVVRFLQAARKGRGRDLSLHGPNSALAHSRRN